MGRKWQKSDDGPPDTAGWDAPSKSSLLPQPLLDPKMHGGNEAEARGEKLSGSFDR